MNIKLVALDLDHTLFDENKKLPKETATLLQKAIDRGVFMTPATGRMFRSARKIMRQLTGTAEGYDVHFPMICYNGALVQYADEASPRYVRYVPEDVERDMAKFCRERGLYLQMYDHDCMVAERRSAIRMSDPIRKDVPLIEWGDYLKAEIPHTPKMLIADEPEVITTLIPEIEERFGERLHITRSDAIYLEMMAPGVNKGSALAWLAEHLGLSKNEVMACGDNDNDLEMLRWAGISVAVANAVPAVQREAVYVAAEERSKGVCEAVNKFIFNTED